MWIIIDLGRRALGLVALTTPHWVTVVSSSSTLKGQSMDADELLSQFTIPTPCSMDWDRMRGDDRKRFCEACGKHVYNLTVMSPDEVVSMMVPFSEQGGEICGRVFQRPDGTLVTSECRPGPPARKGWQFSIRSLMTWIAVIAGWCGFLRWFPMQPMATVGAIRVMPPGVASGPGSSSSCPSGAEDLDSESPGETDPPGESRGSGPLDSDRGDRPGS
jgi:hypothetical protein